MNRTILTLWMCMGFLCAMAQHPISFLYKLDTNGISSEREWNKLDLKADLGRPIDSLGVGEIFDYSQKPYGYYVSRALSGQGITTTLYRHSGIRTVKAIPDGKKNSLIWIQSEDPIISVSLDGKALDQVDDYVFSTKARKGLLKIETDKETSLFSLKRAFTSRKKTWAVANSFSSTGDPFYGRSNSHGFMVFSKPIYRPGDTLKMKAFLLDEAGLPLNQPKQLDIFGKKISLTPKRPGLFLYQTVVSDSQQIDRAYMGQFIFSWYNRVQNSFRLEDYELNAYTYKLEVFPQHDKRDHPIYQKEDIRIVLTGEDANKQAAFGTEVHTKITLVSIAGRTDTMVSLPVHFYEKDTVLHERQLILTFPDSLFSAYTTRYEVEVTLNKPSGEQQIFTKRFSKVPYNKPVGQEVNNLRPPYAKWRRTADSAYIQIFNPDSLHYSVELQHNKKLIKSRHGQDDWSWKVDCVEKDVLTLILYTAQFQDQIYQLPKTNHQLEIQVDQPRKINPGDSITTTITVINNDGKGVAGVDLTALATNAKYKENNIPPVTNFGTNLRVKYKIRGQANRPLEKNRQYEGLKQEDLAEWGLLDSMSYRLRYADLLFTQYETVDDRQFAYISPYLVEGKTGKNKALIMVWLDDRLVYFSGSETKAPFVFKEKEGYHRITWRTSHKRYVLDSVELKRGQHLFLALDTDNFPVDRASMEIVPNKFSKQEIQSLNRYMLRVNRRGVKNGDRFIGSYEQFTFQADRRFQRYNSKKSAYNSAWVGPFLVNQIRYIRPGAYGYHLRKNNRVIHPQSYELVYEEENQKKYAFPSARVPELPSRWVKERLDLLMMRRDLSIRNSHINEIARSNVFLPSSFKRIAFRSTDDPHNFYFTYVSRGGNKLPSGTFDIFAFNDQNNLTYMEGLSFQEDYVHLTPFRAKPLKDSLNWIKLFHQPFRVVQQADQTLFFNPLYEKGDHKLLIYAKGLKDHIDEIILRKNGVMLRGASHFQGDTCIVDHLGKDMYEIFLIGDEWMGYARHTLKWDSSIEIDLVKATNYTQNWQKIRRPFPNKYSLVYEQGEWKRQFVKLAYPRTLEEPFFKNKISTRGNTYYYKVPQKKPLPKPNEKSIIVPEEPFGVGVIQGRVLNSEGEPIQGAAIHIKETTVGTFTDELGFFSLEFSDWNAIVVIQFLGCISQEIPVSRISGEIILETDFLEMEVTVGYSIQRLIPKIRVRGISSTRRKNYGELTAQAVGENTERNDIFKQKERKIQGYLKWTNPLSEVYGNEQSTQSIVSKLTEDSDGDGILDIYNNKSLTIRSDFRDAAYWQPDLLTDSSGRATFTVKMPDDITSWNTYVLAINGNRQSGFVQGNIVSKSPLVAQLEVPRFLIEGDQSEAFGQVMSYEGDSLDISTSFKLKEEEVYSHQLRIGPYHKDIIPFEAGTDSADLTYSVQLKNGYLDGENRKIRVQPQGVSVAKGSFHLLEGDTTLNISPAKEQYIAIMGQPVQLLLQDLHQLWIYRHACNEQLASQLIALKTEQAIRDKMDLKFKGAARIRKIERTIRKRYRKGGWAWWENGPLDMWMTSYVMEAMKGSNFKAKEALNEAFEKRLIKPEPEEELNITQHLHHTRSFLNWGTLSDTAGLKAIMFGWDTLSLTPFQKLEFMAIKQRMGNPISPDSIMELSSQTMTDGIYWGTRNWRWFGGDIEASCLAYRMLKEINPGDSSLKHIRRYLLLERGPSYARNTRESAEMIRTFLPEWKKETWEDSLNLSLVSEKGSRTFDFPSITSVEEGGKLVKTGYGPIYASVFRREWIPDPARMDTFFRVHSGLLEAGKPVSVLKRGKTYHLRVDIETKKAADYVAIEIPIPAGCTYASKNRSSGENHREHFRDKVVIYRRTINEGKHSFYVHLQAKFGGSYTLNPARVELMYVPSKYGNNQVKKVKIESQD
ncbi:MAG: alpha-2-macroglobulin family protein [Bacteroidota bacterium]